MAATASVRSLRRCLVGGAAMAVVVAMAGCGSDDDGDDGGGGGGNAGGSASAAESSAADPAEFCEAAVDLESGFASGPEIDFETATPEEQQQALDEFSAIIDPLLDRAEETAPEDIADDVTTAADGVRNVLGSGDFSAVETEEFAAADDAIDEYMLAECGYEQVEAVAVDYEYEGIPAEVPAGVVAVTLANEGNEIHEIGIVRINDDVTVPLTELIALPEEEAFSAVTFVGRAETEPGGSDTVFLRMDEPGRYGAVCFFTQGTTSHETEGSGPPHAFLGMAAEFQVA